LLGKGKIKKERIERTQRVAAAEEEKKFRTNKREEKKILLWFIFSPFLRLSYRAKDV
jgi:hypothetical protein